MRRILLLGLVACMVAGIVCALDATTLIGPLHPWPVGLISGVGELFRSP
ncbi:hypothetical protein [Pseudomonas carassii]|uniref:Uncharacterized protein n=1 Tax=Pseudomonas carassii TaxID=3115855 RepID=A0ABU7H5F0_9PSED|nr:hypothetical protein [Pseudomonas sp. 137P]MEE1886476.1 hypothetical protein [Pseudomonas sp. 137P]